MNKTFVRVVSIALAALLILSVGATLIGCLVLS